MSLNSTPSADRVHIGIFGKRNAGKSSIINALTGQELAIVSDIPGTTTDPVSKAMELLPLGPVLLIDTPGLDDEGELGNMRVEKAKRTLSKIDVALIVAGCDGLTSLEKELIQQIEDKKLPYIIAYNKAENEPVKSCAENEIYVSARTGMGITKLKEMLAKTVPQGREEYPIIKDLIAPGDIVVLVVPIDSAAPKGRLILPQQQTIRDILDAGAISVVSKETELEAALKSLGKKPKFVVTDSQAFEYVAKVVPEDILLTSFSILFARHKGNLKILAEGARAVETLKDGDKILISEGCTHHRQCDDIGTVKIPRWLKNYTKKELEFEFSSGTGFPKDLSQYKMIIHCGGCMLNEREMKYRISCAEAAGVPIVNYGILIAYLKGILERSVKGVL